MSLADGLALLRALAVIPVAWAVAADLRLAALAIFVLAASSDAVDGWIARRSGGGGPRGAFLDPMADKVLVVGTLIALAAAGRGWPVTVVAVLATLREGIAAAARTRAFRRGWTLPADRIAKLKTAAEMTGIALVIPDGRPWAVLGAALVGVAVLVGFVTLPHYVASRGPRLT